MMKKTVLFLLFALVPMFLWAETVEIDGICYNLINKIKKAEVVHKEGGYKSYSGDIVIPSSVTYNGIDYNVISINEAAFQICYKITSVSIPQSVTTIGNYAFEDCTSLKSIKIPNSVETIGDYAFMGCSSLESLTIPNSVSSLGNYCFAGCSNLETIRVEDGNVNYDSRNNCNAIIESNSNKLICGCKNTIIPNSVEVVGASAFRACSDLASILIPKSVLSIEDGAFEDCVVLTSVLFTSGITSIGYAAFIRCKNLTTIEFPNSVVAIGDYSFAQCSKLSSIYIGADIKVLGSGVFSNCVELSDVYCYAIEVPDNMYLSKHSVHYGKHCTDAFEESLIEYATLHVPASAINKYKTTEPWKNFKNIVSLENEAPTLPKCETPTISYENGELKMTCATEGVEFVTDITDADIKKHYDAEIKLSATYNISVYATKAGYDISDVVHATLCWIDAAPKTEGITNGVTNVNARAVLIQNNGGIITVNGVDDGMRVSAYSLNGVEEASAISRNGAAVLNTNAHTGSTVIVKMGEKTVKVLMK